MFRFSLFLFPLLLVSAFSKDTKGEPQASDAAKTVSIAAPIYPNASCPIMGKPVSTKLFADTDKGRIYVCCKSCVKDILADVATAYRTAYPTNKVVENKICPVSGGAITKDSPTVVLQGFTFFVRGPQDVAPAREHAQIVLAKLNDPTLVDLENETCPVTGEPVAKNTFVVIEKTIVRLASVRNLDEISKDPAKVLKKAREIRAKEVKAREEKEREAAKSQGEVKKP